MEKELHEEIVEWEEELNQEQIQRLYKTQKEFIDPRLKKMKDFRNRNRGYKYHYDSECKEIRKMTNRKFRRKMKKEIYAEEYYKLTPHDFNTYGWLTW